MGADASCNLKRDWDEFQREYGNVCSCRKQVDPEPAECIRADGIAHRERSLPGSPARYMQAKGALSNPGSPCNRVAPKFGMPVDAHPDSHILPWVPAVCHGTPAARRSLDPQPPRVAVAFANASPVERTHRALHRSPDRYVQPLPADVRLASSSPTGHRGTPPCTTWVPQSPPAEPFAAGPYTGGSVSVQSGSRAGSISLCVGSSGGSVEVWPAPSDGRVLGAVLGSPSVGPSIVGTPRGQTRAIGFSPRAAQLIPNSSKSRDASPRLLDNLSASGRAHVPPQTRASPRGCIDYSAGAAFAASSWPRPSPPSPISPYRELPAARCLQPPLSASCHLQSPALPAAPARTDVVDEDTDANLPPRANSYKVIKFIQSDFESQVSFARLSQCDLLNVPEEQRHEAQIVDLS